ncbi:ABC transporter ATP-binding protein/permease [Candidatus Dependentiae bacterium]|nr:ABC transporter ATP-binding protein/permease [Candidatus Dependentiae bacterium]
MHSALTTLLRLIAVYPRHFIINAFLCTFDYSLPLLPAIVLRNYFNGLEANVQNCSWLLTIIAAWIVTNALRAPLVTIVQTSDARYKSKLSNYLWRQVIVSIVHTEAPTIPPLSNIKEDIEIITEFMYWIVYLPCLIIVSIIGLGLIMTITWTAAIPMIIAAFCIALVASLVQPRIELRQQEEQIAAQHVTTIIYKVLQAIDPVQQFGKQEFAKETILQLTKQKRQAILRNLLNNQLIDLIFSLIDVFGDSLTVIIAAAMLLQGAITTGDFVFLVTYLPWLSEIMYYAGNYRSTFTQASVAIARFDKILQQKKELTAPRLLPGSSSTTEGPLLAARNIKATATMPPINFTLMPGECLQIIGPNGAGKTVLAKTIAGLRDPYAGNFIFHGMTVSSMKPFLNPSIISFVGADEPLIANTLLHNVTMGNKIDEHSLLKLLASLGLGDLIERLPDGLYTMISSSTPIFGLSERFRILLARALLHKPQLLIVDDPAVIADPPTLQLILRSLVHQRKQTLIITSLHPLEMVRADKTMRLSRS